MSEDPSTGGEQKKQSWIPKDFLKEVKSFANTEGKQMVGFVRDKFREAMDEDEQDEEPTPDKEIKKRPIVVLDPEVLDALKSAAKVTGKSVAELIRECVTRSLEEVIQEEDAKKKEAISKLKLLKKEGDSSSPR